jgi:hypothetical protein
VPWCCWVSPSERTHSPSRPASSHPREAFLLLSPSLAHLCSRAISTEARLRLRLRRPAHVLPCPCSQSSTTTPTCLPPSLCSHGPSARSQPATPTQDPSLSTLARRATSLDDRRRILAARTRTRQSNCLLIASQVCAFSVRLSFAGMPTAWERGCQQRGDFACGLHARAAMSVPDLMLTVLDRSRSVVDLT